MDGLYNQRPGSHRRELVAPCKGCRERTPGCHDHCERYAQYKGVVADKNAYMKRSQWDEYDPLAPKRRRDL